MPEQRVPEEAIDAIREDLIADGWDDPTPCVIARRAHITTDQALASINEDLHDALLAALPALNKARDDELKEALLSGDTLRSVARRRHEAEHAAGFDDLAWDALPVDRQLRQMDEAKRDLTTALTAIFEEDGK